jgi:predicted O-methyltransferase YrrM
LNYHLLKEFINYWLRCVDEHSLHSPFVYDLYTKVIKPIARISEGQPEIEALRKRLQANNQKILTKTFGATSTINRNPERMISDIAGEGVSPRKYSQLYLQMGLFFEMKSIWELGTSLGINTLYLASIPESEVTTFEGCHNTLEIAKQNFESLNRSNIKSIEGNIDSTLRYELGKVRELDMVFFDANHRKEPTIRYFEECSKMTHASSLFIFDDIHWSKEMDLAWKEIKDHPLSRITIDLFQCGLVFFDPEMPKQHFILDF